MTWRFDKTIYLSFLLKSILSERLGNNLCESEVLLFSEFINIVSILYYIYTEFIILLYTIENIVSGIQLDNK